MKTTEKNQLNLTLAFVATALPIFFFHFLLKFSRIQNLDVINTWVYLDLYKSDVFFYFGFLSLSLFALSFARGRLQVFCLVFLQFTIVILTLLEISAHNYFIKTGAHLSWHLLAYTLQNFAQVSQVMASETSLTSQLMLWGAPSFVVVFPWLVFLLLNKIDFARLTVSLLKLRVSSLTLFFVFSACLVLPPFTNKDTLFAQNFVFNIISSYIETKLDSDKNNLNKWQHPIDTSLQRRLINNRRKNLVILVLESVRANATSVYGGKYHTTPFLKSLASKSMVANWAFSVVPHTSKCLVSIHCGIEPNTVMAIEEAKKYGIAAKCLPKLLNEQGYRSVYFQSPWKWFENREGLIANIGHSDFYSGESMSTEGFDEINYFGHEDRMMLKPSQKWLQNHQKNHSDKPFMVTYLTGGSHHYYGLPKKYKRKQYHKKTKFNRYLNTIKITDDFVKSIINQYKELGLYKNTVFVIVGDHGEGFGEHGVTGHSFVGYEESLHVPLIIHSASHFQKGLRLHHLVQQQDILPTVTNLLGYQIINNSYRGISMLKPRADRVLYSSCWHENECLTRYQRDLKILHYFNKKPDEAYFIDKDPFETENVIDQIKNKQALLKDSLKWYRNLMHFYASYKDDKIIAKNNATKKAN